MGYVSNFSYSKRCILTEAVAALIFAFFVFSFVIDLLPSVRTKKRVPQGEKYLRPTPDGPVDF